MKKDNHIMDDHKEDECPDTSVAQENEILGIGLALQVVINGEVDHYDENYLNQIIGRIDSISVELGLSSQNHQDIMKGFMQERTGEYRYGPASSLKEHTDEITVAYSKLTNVALR